MACAHRLKTLRQGVIQKDAKLHLTVTIHIWIRRDAITVARQQVINNAVAILINEIHHPEFDTECLGHRMSVLYILLPWAVPRDALFIDPVLHVTARHLVPLLQQKGSGDG